MKKLILARAEGELISVISSTVDIMWIAQYTLIISVHELQYIKL